MCLLSFRQKTLIRCLRRKTKSIHSLNEFLQKTKYSEKEVRSLLPFYFVEVQRLGLVDPLSDAPFPDCWLDITEKGKAYLQHDFKINSKDLLHWIVSIAALVIGIANLLWMVLSSTQGK